MNLHQLSILTLAAGMLLPAGVAAQRLALQASTIIHEDNSKTLSTRKFKERTMEQRTFTPRGVLQMKRLFTLARDGRVVSGLAFDGKNNLIFTFRYKFDDLDRLSEERVLNKKGQVVGIYVTTYDERGKGTRTALVPPRPGGFTSEQLKMLEHPEQLEKRGKKVDGDPFGLDKSRR